MKAIFTTPLILASLLLPSLAQTAAPEADTVVEKKAEVLLAKGNSWTYDVTLTIPKDLDFKPEFDVPGEITPRGMVYKFSEKQVSNGPQPIESLKADVPVIDIFIENKLKKKQVLNYTNDQLHYHGTFMNNAEDPTKKVGFITIVPIVLYNKVAKIGDKWSWTTEKMPRFEFRVVSKNTKIEILGKTYITDKIRMDRIDKTTSNTLVSKEYWFAEGIGIVKEQEKKYISRDQAIVKTLELKEFKKAIK